MTVHNVKIQQNKKEKKGLFPFLSNLFKGSGGVGSGAAGSGSTVAGSSGLFGGLFSGSGMGGGLMATLLGTKAGIAGLVIGAMTLLAGAGIIYNVVSHNSGDVNAKGLFSDPYYDALVSDAQSNRAAKGNVVDSRSSLDYFKDTAKKDELFTKAPETKASSATVNAADEEKKADAAAEAPEAVIPRMAAASGLSGGGGGGGGTASGGNLASPSALGSGGVTKGAVFADSARTGTAGAMGASNVRAGRTAGAGRKVGAMSGARNQAQAVKTGLGGAGSTADSKRGALVDAYENNDKTGEVTSGGAGLSGGAGMTDPANTPKNSSSITPAEGSGGGGDTSDTEGEDDSTWAWMSKLAVILVGIAVLILALLAFCGKQPWLKAYAAKLLMIAKMCAGLALMLGVMMMFMGGQMKQGMMISLISGIVLAAAFLAFNGADTAPAASAEASAAGGASVTPGAGAPASFSSVGANGEIIASNGVLSTNATTGVHTFVGTTTITPPPVVVP